MATQTMQVDVRQAQGMWLPDGDVVIVCPTAAFRVHEVIISRHSRVFRDICSGAKAGGVQDVPQLNVTGCIVLHVVDSAYDIEQLLHAFYDGLSYLNPTETAPFPILAALARMAHKYQLDRLLAEVTRRLRSVFTDSFEVWCQYRGGSTELAIVEPHHAIEALNLCRATGRTDMLPAAFYMCTRLDSDTLVRGVLRADGSTLEVLNDFDLARCLSAQDEFRNREVRMAQNLSTMLPYSTRDSRECIDRFRELQEFMYDKFYFVARADPLGTDLSLRFDQFHTDGLLCDACVGFRKHYLYEKQADLWEELSSIAGVGATHASSEEASSRLLNAGETSDACLVQDADAVTRDAETWLPDGNVVVVAESIEFRFHQSHISRNSDVFDGLFGIAQPSREDASSPHFSDSRNGCAIVPVSDTAYDFRHLLLALYEGARTCLSATEAVPFSVLAAIARMAHKYQVDWLLAEATRRLKTAFPDRFKVWPEDSNLSTVSVTVDVRDAIEAFNLFRRIGRVDMLPAAFYACCQLDLSDLLHGVQRVGSAFVEKLDTDDLQRCLKSRREFKEANVKLAHTLFLGPVSPTCSTEQECREQGGSCHECEMEGYYLCADANSLGPYFRDHLELFAGDQSIFCPECTQMMKDKELAARLAAWRNLPGYAGVYVEGWDSA